MSKRQFAWMVMGRLTAAALLLVVALAAVPAVATATRAGTTKTKAQRLPYTAIDHPQFFPAAQATFLNPNDLLIGVTDGKTAKAYPSAILAQHGVVQDRMAHGPIAVTWCSYCNTALVFRAEAKGQALEFDTAGVVGSNEVFKDRETGSRWQQSSLEAISGPLKGTRLKMYPFLLATWREWRKLHPNTLVLKPLPGYAARLADMNEIINQGIVGMAGPAPYGALRHDHRLRPRDTIVGLETDGAMKAYPISALQKVRVVNDRVGGNPVLIVHQPPSDTTTAFIAKVNGRTLRFRAIDAAADRLIDVETHSTWNAYGDCLAGRLKGSHLRRLILEPEFWFAWSEFHPKTELYVLPKSHNSGSS